LKKILFVCSRNRRRSPTAEQIFGNRSDCEVSSAGLAPDAEEMLSPEIIQWAEMIFVMEKKQRAKLSQQFSPHLKNKRVICLDIADNYEFMQPELIDLLLAKVEPFLSGNSF
jgi:predicted protein tyrosine phosphatase